MKQNDENDHGCGNSRPTVVTYHIHRCMVGPRCEYFTRLFDNTFSESQSQHSRIEFSAVLTNNSFDKILKAFESFLDLCYFDKSIETGTPFDFYNEKLSPVALHFLSDYLQIQNDDFASQLTSYTEKVREYLSVLMKNVLYTRVLNSPNEYTCVLCKELINFRSEGLNVKMVEAMFIQCCYENRKCLSPRAPLTKVFDITLWISLVSYLEDKLVVGGDECIDWSNNIAYYIDENSKVIDEDAFRTLTHTGVLPTIHPNAAIILLKEEMIRGLDKYDVVDGQEDDGEDVDSGDDADDEDDDDVDDNDNELTHLQQRCVDSFEAADLENPDNNELRDKAIDVMSPTFAKMYLKRVLLRDRQGGWV